MSDSGESRSAMGRLPAVIFSFQHFIRHSEILNSSLLPPPPKVAPRMSLHAMKPPAHPGAAILAIGGMSLVLAVVVQLMGLARRFDTVVTGWMEGIGLEGKLRALPPLLPWVWTVLIVFGLTAAILGSRRNWRRTVLWVSAIVLTLGWVPVLALAAYRPAVTMPLIALLWCGLWAMIYATRHQEPGDAPD
jgi:hypothetical protein